MNAEETVEIPHGLIASEAEELAGPIGYLCLSVGVKFYVRQLSEEEKAKLVADLAAPGSSKPRDIALTACLCNHDGGRGFHPETIAAMKKTSDKDAERLYRLACEHNEIEYVPTKAK